MDLQGLIWGLEELADAELQERLWTGKVHNEMSSFEEAISTTFDDTGLALMLDEARQPEEFSPEIMQLAVVLDCAVKQVPQDAAPMDVIRHPAMKEVRRLAAELLHHLKS